MDEQEASGGATSPSRMIWRMGEKIDDPSSICYWANRNRIPIFCPAITDGSIGDMLFFHSYKRPGLVVDLVQDIRAINSMAVDARRTGAPATHSGSDEGRHCGQSAHIQQTPSIIQHSDRTTDRPHLLSSHNA